MELDFVLVVTRHQMMAAILRKPMLPMRLEPRPIYFGLGNQVASLSFKFGESPYFKYTNLC